MRPAFEDDIQSVIFWEFGSTLPCPDSWRKRGNKLSLCVFKVSQIETTCGGILQSALHSVRNSGRAPFDIFFKVCDVISAANEQSRRDFLTKVKIVKVTRLILCYGGSDWESRTAASKRKKSSDSYRHKTRGLSVGASSPHSSPLGALPGTQH